MNNWKKLVSCFLAVFLTLTVLICVAAEPANGTDPQPEKNGEIYILFTSDVHCGIDQGFGYAGLQQVRDTLESQGYETILVDDGDSIQGEVIGTLTKGEALVIMMNRLGYDAAIPGNHEFDYGMDNFLALTEKAEFPYICCNLNYMGEKVLPPYVILEAAGKKDRVCGSDDSHDGQQFFTGKFHERGARVCL